MLDAEAGSGSVAAAARKTAKKRNYGRTALDRQHLRKKHDIRTASSFRSAIGVVDQILDRENEEVRPIPLGILFNSNGLILTHTHTHTHTPE